MSDAFTLPLRRAKTGTLEGAVNASREVTLIDEVLAWNHGRH